MTRYTLMKGAVLAPVLVLLLSSAASAYNRAHVILPSGECIIVGSEKSVTLPDATQLDLRPETVPADEIGTAYAADEGQSPSRRAHASRQSPRHAGRHGRSPRVDEMKSPRAGPPPQSGSCSSPDAAPPTRVREVSSRWARTSSSACRRADCTR